MGLRHQIMQYNQLSSAKYVQRAGGVTLRGNLESLSIVQKVNEQ